MLLPLLQLLKALGMRERDKGVVEYRRLCILFLFSYGLDWLDPVTWVYKSCFYSGVSVVLVVLDL